jgi:hypothetical protein
VAVDERHELGPVAGVCTRCDAAGRLVLVELRPRPALRARLLGRRSDPTARSVSCGSCGWQWDVRLSDTPATASAVVAQRAAAAEADRVRAASGAHRDRRKSSVPAQDELVVFGPAASPPPVAAADAPAAVAVPWPRSCPRRVPT